MNPPLPTYYDPANARQLVKLAAQSYASDQSDVSDLSDKSQVIENPATDTRAVISELCTLHSPLSTDLVVSFRGTADLRNWLTDLDWKKAPLYWSAGKVHRGFNLALESVAEKLDAALHPGDPRRLWITGHSLGGALAMLFALRLKQRRRANVAGVYTYGQPRVGDLSFSRAYDNALKACTYRVIHADDLVPRVPWLLGAYRHAGHEVLFPSATMTNDKFSMTNSQSQDGAIENRPLKICNWQFDPSFWMRLPNDLRNLARELTQGQFAPLADHHITRYVEMLSGVEQASGLSVLASGQNNSPFRPCLGGTPKQTGGTPVPPSHSHERL